MLVNLKEKLYDMSGDVVRGGTCYLCGQKMQQQGEQGESVESDFSLYDCIAASLMRASKATQGRSLRENEDLGNLLVELRTSFRMSRKYKFNSNQTKDIKEAVNETFPAIIVFQVSELLDERLNPLDPEILKAEMLAIEEANNENKE